MYNKLKKFVIYLGLSLAMVGCANPNLTLTNLHEAVRGESHGEICCYQYAIRAENDSLFKSSLLLNVIGKSQQIHKNLFTDLLKKHGVDYSDSIVISKYEVDSTIVNLYRLLADNQYEFYNLYPEFSENAKKEGDRKAKKCFRQVMDASENQLKTIQILIDSISKTGSDNFLSDSWHVCQECGNIVSGDVQPKEKCQICKCQQFISYNL